MNFIDPALLRDAALLDSFPADSPAPETSGEPGRETILLIHGTFANEALSWWLPGSDFCRKLDASLLARQSPARCWAHIASPNDAFAWTGDNLESERRLGGDMLVKAIKNLERAPDIDRYHIVAHSHGGNLALHALRSLAKCPKKLGATIFLGTPVLSFPRWHLELSRHARLLLLYASGLIASIIAAWYFGQSPASFVVSEGNFYNALLDSRDYPWCILLAALFALLLLVEFITRPQRLRSIYGSGHSHAFEFVPDEAMKALQLSLDVAQRPGDVLKQLYGTEVAPAYAVVPSRDGFWKGTWSGFQATAIYRLYEDSGYPNIFARAARDRTACEWLAIIFCTIFATRALLQLLLPLLGVCIHSFKVMLYLEDPIAQVSSMSGTISNTAAFLLIGTVLGSMIAMFLWQFLLALKKLARSIRARTMQRLLQRPGAWIMGMVIRNAAFGGRCIQVLGPHQLPEKERAHSETISPELNRKMNDLSTSTLAQAGQAIYGALSEGDPTQFRKHILARLTDPKLAHCQYYCEDEIVNRIADLVALPVLDRPLIAPSIAPMDARPFRSGPTAQLSRAPTPVSTR
jgi:pimeloyl-ACP methyl ester carboxylesterase